MTLFTSMGLLRLGLGFAVPFCERDSWGEDEDSEKLVAFTFRWKGFAEESLVVDMDLSRLPLRGLSAADTGAGASCARTGHARATEDAKDEEDDDVVESTEEGAETVMGLGIASGIAGGGIDGGGGGGGKCSFEILGQSDVVATELLFGDVAAALVAVETEAALGLWVSAYEGNWVDGED